MWSLVVVALSAVPVPPGCEQPELREVTDLKQLAQQSGALSVGLDSIATWCFDSGGAWSGGQVVKKGAAPRADAVPLGDCAKAVGTCTTAKAATSSALRKLLFDALADFGRPYRGQTYTLKRTGLTERPSEDADCNSKDRSVLFQQAQTRMDFGRLASQVQSEYGSYRSWLLTLSLRCAQEAGRKGDGTQRTVTVEESLDRLPTTYGSQGANGAGAEGRPGATGQTGAAGGAAAGKASGGGGAPGSGTAGGGTVGGGTAGGGTVGGGTVGGGTAGGGTAGGGTAGGGTAGGGTAGGGTAGGGTAGGGTAGGGASVGGSAGAGTYGGGATGAGRGGTSPAGSGTAGSGTAGGGTYVGGTYVGGSAGSGTAGVGTVGSGTYGGGTAGSGTAGSGTFGGGPAGGGTAGGGTAGGGTAGGGNYGGGSAGAGTSGSGGTGAGRAGTGPAGSGSAGSGSTGNGASAGNVGGGAAASGPGSASLSGSPVPPRGSGAPGAGVWVPTTTVQQGGDSQARAGVTSVSIPIGPAPTSAAALPPNSAALAAHLEQWRGYAARRAEFEADRDYTLGFLASRELRDCRCQRPIPSLIVRALEAGSPSPEPDDEKAATCEQCVEDAFSAWKSRVRKQCVLVGLLSAYELGVFERSDDNNGLPPRCLNEAKTKLGVATAPRPAAGKSSTQGGGFVVTRNEEKPAGESLGPMTTTGQGTTESFVRPQDYAPVPLREDGRLYVRLFMSSACVAEILPGPISGRTGDLMLIPFGARSLSVRSPCGGLAEVYWGKEPKPRVSEIFPRFQPLQLEFRAQ